MRIGLALGLRTIALITLVAPPGDSASESYRTRLNCPCPNDQSRQRPNPQVCVGECNGPIGA